MDRYILFTISLETWTMPLKFLCDMQDRKLLYKVDDMMDITAGADDWCSYVDTTQPKFIELGMIIGKLVSDVKLDLKGKYFDIENDFEESEEFLELNDEQQFEILEKLYKNSIS